MGEAELENEKIITAIKEEYENKIAEINKQHEEEIKKIKEEEEEKRIKQLRALISGRKEEKDIVVEKEESKGFFEMAVEETLNNFKF